MLDSETNHRRQPKIQIRIPRQSDYECISREWILDWVVDSGDRDLFEGLREPSIIIVLRENDVH